MRILTRSKRGFTVVEALAAFTLLAIGLATLFSGLSGAVRNDMRAEFQMMASRLAQSRLAIAGVAEPLVPGVSQGASDEGLAWRQTIEPYGAPTRDDGDAPPAAYLVRVEVRPVNGDAQNLSLKLETIKLDLTGARS
jgi:general secretion pathway protein I